MLIHFAKQQDVPRMVELSEDKRRSYEKVIPYFWERAENANEYQHRWFSSLLNNENYLLYVAEDGHEVSGFVIGQIIKAPDVYAPGGFTLSIDDFCVASSALWDTVGSKLLEAVINEGKKRGAVQVLVVCGHHDEVKRSFLQSQNLQIASEWYVKSV